MFCVTAGAAHVIYVAPVVTSVCVHGRAEYQVVLRVRKLVRVHSIQGNDVGRDPRSRPLAFRRPRQGVLSPPPTVSTTIGRGTNLGDEGHE